MAREQAEVTWIVFKSFVKRSWLWLKEHWQIPFLALWTILVYVLTRRNTDALIEVMEAKRNSYKKQIEALRASHNDEILKRDKLLEQYEETLDKVEEKFKEEEKKLTESQKNEIKEVVVKSKGNPDEIRKRIEEEFGIRYVE
jgi:hypothetical protein